MSPPPLEILYPQWEAYALIDSGHGEKLERFGEHVLRRGEPKAWWSPRLAKAKWGEAVAMHDDGSGAWKTLGKGFGHPWEISHDALRLELRLTDNSKHVGVFPEQQPHWERIRAVARRAGVAGGNARCLNLFGYTGAASLVAAASGFHVTHVDASKPAMEWGRRNQALCGLKDKPVRWILEDARRYCQRELKRGSRYEAILLDPPSFGRGPKKELWKVERDLPALLDLCRGLLAPEPLLLLLTSYSVEASALSMLNLLRPIAPMASGFRCGELAIPHEDDERWLPLSLWSSWESSI
jgi:23S rRNA (cytosine1962-C5)-methyltransferase